MHVTASDQQGGKSDFSDMHGSGGSCHGWVSGGLNGVVGRWPNYLAGAALAGATSAAGGAIIWVMGAIMGAIMFIGCIIWPMGADI